MMLISSKEIELFKLNESDTEQAQLSNCCTLPQNNLTYPLQPVIYIG
jgi:hypothetical protein